MKNQCLRSDIRGCGLEDEIKKYPRFSFELQQLQIVLKYSIAVRKHSREIQSVLENLFIETQGKYNTSNISDRFIHTLVH